jgi:hypothetical protein
MVGEDKGIEQRRWLLGEERWNKMSPPQQARLARMLGLNGMEDLFDYLGNTTDEQFATMLVRLDSRH